MDKRKNKIFLKRAFSLMLSAVVLFTGLPLEMLAAPQSMDSKVADEDVLLLQNDSISVRMSGKNGGFYISNVEGDKTIKSDNNKDLLSTLPDGILMAGDGAVMHRERILNALPNARFAEGNDIIADRIGLAAYDKLVRGETVIEALPLYLRPSQAERLAKERNK